MFEVAGFLKITFLALIVFYVCIQVTLLISEVRTAEHETDAVPSAFSGLVSLEEHRKAIDFTAEIVQSDTINALVGAAVTLLFTLGGGIDLLWACMSVLSDQGIASQFVLVVFILLVLGILDLPFDWWRNFRILERYGMERTNAKTWLRSRIRTTCVGWLTDLPIVLILLVILNLTSYFWWMLCFLACFAWYFWREYLYPTWIVGLSKEAVELPDGSLKEKLNALIHDLGFSEVKIYTLNRPQGLKHTNALLVQPSAKPRLILFRHTLNCLTEEEILAVSANAIAQVGRWHRFARCVVFFALSLAFWWGFAWIADKAYFYEALGIHPSIALANGAPIPGVLMAIVITTFPVLLYPIVFLIHILTRRLEYDADACVVRMVGAKPLIHAIVKLHTDYRNSLTPDRLYSVANHRRPHITHRILAAQIESERLQVLARKARLERINDRQILFNAILARREKERTQKISHLVESEREKLQEALNLQKRTYTVEN